MPRWLTWIACLVVVLVAVGRFGWWAFPVVAVVVLVLGELHDRYRVVRR